MENDSYWMRYHAKSRASINEWSKMQSNERPRLSVFHQDRDATIYLLDNIEQHGIKLHNGLDIVVSLNNYRGGNVIEETQGLANLTLDVVSFVTMAYCELDRFDLQIIFHEDGTTDGVIPVSSPSTLDLSVPRKIQEDVFCSVYANRDKLYESDKEHVARAMAWSRASILQKQPLFEFMCLWIGIESINHVLSRALPTIKGKKNVLKNNWRGLFDIANKKVADLDFEELIYARQQIFHSRGDISDAFVTKLATYLEPTRKVLNYGIGSVLKLDEEMIKSIAERTALKMFILEPLAYNGRFTGLRNNIDWLLTNNPKLLINDAQNEYHFNDAGDPETVIKTNTTANFADGVKFSAHGWQLKEQGNSGVKITNVKINS